MSFSFFMPTRVIIGKESIKNNINELIKWGKNPVIVTGKTSGVKSGALDDVVSVLKANDQNYSIFDRVINNPTLENVEDGGNFAREAHSDYIIAIGGGSPLDAAKAIAVLATNDISPEELYSGNFKNMPLPIVAIPTTAGTGSEVTPYSILTYKGINNKKSFACDDVFPKVTFLDATYTMELPHEVTIHTAVDALSHAVEGYISLKSNQMTDIIALEVIKLFSECCAELTSDVIDFEVREKLLYLAMLAGVVISHTATTIVHSMGYPLTYFKDIPHGKANGLLLGQFLKFNYESSKDKIDRILKLMKLDSIDDFSDLIKKLIPKDYEFTIDELREFASISIEAKNVSSNVRKVTYEDELDIFVKSLLE